jgi:hypothetical protein
MSARYLGLLADPADERVGGRLLATLGDPDAFVRGQVAIALGLLRYRPALDALMRMAREDAEWLARVDALEALESLGQPEAFLALAEVLMSDPSAVARRYAASAIRAVARETDREALARLVEARREEPACLIHLLLASYWLGDASAFPQIRALLDGTQDAEDAAYLLHVVGAAYRTQPPAHILTDVPALLSAVSDLGQRLPDTRLACDELADHLLAA